LDIVISFLNLGRFGNRNKMWPSVNRLY